MVKIVKAEEYHIPAICRLWLEFMRFSEDIDPIFTVREGAETDFEKKFLHPRMNDNNSLVLVALDGEKMVAYSVSQIQEDLKVIKPEIKTASIVHLFVTKDYRRRGIGEKMYAEMLRWFHARDINRVELQVIVRNKSAVSFWKKHGYLDFQNTLYTQI
jgi:ribosomal protein S18 acetylase RimI-like enzyme